MKRKSCQEEKNTRKIAARFPAYRWQLLLPYYVSLLSWKTAVWEIRDLDAIIIQYILILAFHRKRK